MHFHNFKSLTLLLHVVTMELSPGGRSRVHGRPPYSRLAPLPSLSPTYLKDPLAPAHGLANPHMLEPNNNPVSGLYAGTTFMPVL